jgi:hypothetical protein
MRKVFIIIMSLLMCQTGFGQEKVSANEFYKNRVKLNLFALPIRSFSVQYERGLNENISVSMGIRLQPKGPIPFRNAIKNSYDADSIDVDFLDNARISSWAITPEFRYYFGKKPLNGFYVAPYIRLEGNKLDWTYKYTEDNGNVRNIGIHGKTSGIAGGLMLGAQWRLAKRMLVDWWIIGVAYGSYKVTLNGASDLSDMSAADKKEIEDTIESSGFGNNGFNATVTNSGVTADVKVGLPGIRTGLCIGYTF